MPGSESILLDTNAVIALLGGDRELLQTLGGAGEARVCVVTLEELYFGAEKSTRARENREKVSLMVGDLRPLEIDATTSRLYGEIFAELRRKGRPIPTNDVWIAAQCRQHSHRLLTKDRHFAEVAGLEVVRW